MSIETLHPDWGEPAVLHNGILGVVPSPAATLRQVRAGGYPLARPAYRAILRHWRICQHLPGLTEMERQGEALRRGFDEVCARHARMG